jgi:hypothetical protein
MNVDQIMVLAKSEAALREEVARLRAENEALREDAERYRWLAKEHGWWLLKHFAAVRPYVDASEVIDESIDAARKT